MSWFYWLYIAGAVIYFYCAFIAWQTKKKWEEAARHANKEMLTYYMMRMELKK